MSELEIYHVKVSCGFDMYSECFDTLESAKEYANNEFYYGINSGDKSHKVEIYALTEDYLHYDYDIVYSLSYDEDKNVVTVIRDGFGV